MLFVLTLSLLEVNTNVNTANAYNNETSNVELGNWSFTQAGQYNPVQAGNEGYIRSVTVGNDVLSNWERDVNQKQVQSASTGSNEFKIEIANTGWEVQWKQKPLRIQPDAVMASTIVDAKINHKYVVSFTAKASSKKYAYVRFGTEKEGVLPYDSHGIVCADNATKQVIEIGTTEQKYTFIFSNEVYAKKLQRILCWGHLDDITLQRHMIWMAMTLVTLLRKMIWCGMAQLRLRILQLQIMDRITT